MHFWFFGYHCRDFAFKKQDFRRATVLLYCNGCSCNALIPCTFPHKGNWGEPTNDYSKAVQDYLTLSRILIAAQICRFKCIRVYLRACMLISSAICLIVRDENTGVFSLRLNNIMMLCRLTYMGTHVRTYSYIQMYTRRYIGCQWASWQAQDVFSFSWNSVERYSCDM